MFHHDIQTPRSGSKKRGAPVFFNRLRGHGVWTPDKTLFRVFDMASQSIHNSCMLIKGAASRGFCYFR